MRYEDKNISVNIYTNEVIYIFKTNLIYFFNNLDIYLIKQRFISNSYFTGRLVYISRMNKNSIWERNEAQD